MKPQAEEILAEEQSGFRWGGAQHTREEQILYLRILCERYLQHQQTSIMFCGLQETIRQGTCSSTIDHETIITTNMNRDIESPYCKAISAVYLTA